MRETFSEDIKQYHSEEILMILYILSSDLSTYSDSTLISFTEDIEGRIDVLFEANFLNSLTHFLPINSDFMGEFIELKNLVTILYSSEWYKKLKNNSNENIINIKKLAFSILKKLKIEYIEPLKYSDENLKI